MSTIYFADKQYIDDVWMMCYCECFIGVRVAHDHARYANKLQRRLHGMGGLRDLPALRSIHRLRPRAPVRSIISDQTLRNQT